MSVNGPDGRYAPLRGTQRAVVEKLRRGDWTKGVPALAGVLASTDAQVWRALTLLTARRLIFAVRDQDGGMRIWLTRAGLGIRL